MSFAALSAYLVIRRNIREPRNQLRSRIPVAVVGARKRPALPLPAILA
jgi:hypothetical protein